MSSIFWHAPQCSPVKVNSAGWSGNVFDLYLGDAQFESQPLHRLFWLGFPVTFLGPLAKRRDSTSNLAMPASFHIHFKSSFTYTTIPH
jgi:hypothetical protein